MNAEQALVYVSPEEIDKRVAAPSCTSQPVLAPAGPAGAQVGRSPILGLVARQFLGWSPTNAKLSGLVLGPSAC